MMEEPVAVIMTREVHAVEVGRSLREAEKLMKKHHVRHMPVVKGEELVGMLSLNDLLRLSFVDSYGYEEEENIDTAIYQMLNIEQVMVAHPKTVEVTDTIRKVAQIFVAEEFHALPVIEGKKLVGIVTTTDVIRFLLEM